MTTAISPSDAESLAILIDRIKTLRDKAQSGDISEKDKDFFRGICEASWPHDPKEAVRYLNDVIKEITIKKAFLTHRSTLFKACLKGYAHFTIAKKVQSDNLQGHLVFNQNPNFWFFTFSAHSECAFSCLINIIEKRERANPNNITIYKFLNIIEQNASLLFETKNKDIVMCEIIKDRSSLNNTNETITKLMALRDRFLFHYDRNAFTNRTFFQNNEIDDDSLNAMYLHLEKILNKYSSLYDGTEMQPALSSWKIPFDLEFKAFED